MVLSLVLLCFNVQAASLPVENQIGELSVQWSRTITGPCTATLTQKYRQSNGRGMWKQTSGVFALNAGNMSGNLPGSPFTLAGNYQFVLMFDNGSTTETAEWKGQSFGWDLKPSDCGSSSPFPLFLEAMEDDLYTSMIFPRSVDDLTTLPNVPVEVQKIMLFLGNSIIARNRNRGNDFIAREICREIDTANFQTTYGLPSDLSRNDRDFLFTFLGYTARLYMAAKINTQIQDLLNTRNSYNKKNVYKMKEL